jgi:hypothetical protein
MVREGSKSPTKTSLGGLDKQYMTCTNAHTIFSRRRN